MIDIPKICCRRCEGKGKHPMPPAYAAVYRLLSHEWQTTTEINANLPKVQQTALCNRLAWLKREGFIEGRQTEHNGRLYEWRIA